MFEEESYEWNVRYAELYAKSRSRSDPRATDTQIHCWTMRKICIEEADENYVPIDSNSIYKFMYDLTANLANVSLDLLYKLSTQCGPLKIRHRCRRSLYEIDALNKKNIHNLVDCYNVRLKDIRVVYVPSTAKTNKDYMAMTHTLKANSTVYRRPRASDPEYDHA